MKQFFLSIWTIKKLNFYVIVYQNLICWQHYIYVVVLTSFTTMFALSLFKSWYKVRMRLPFNQLWFLVFNAFIKQCILAINFITGLKSTFAYIWRCNDSHLVKFHNICRHFHIHFVQSYVKRNP